LLKETIESLDHSKTTAEKTIPEMWEELKAKGWERREAREEMIKDFGGRWGEWSLFFTDYYFR
jgi:hypothetical protein